MLKDVILKNGYVKKGYGYYKEINVGDEDGECVISHLGNNIRRSRL